MEGGECKILISFSMSRLSFSLSRYVLCSQPYSLRWCATLDLWMVVWGVATIRLCPQVRLHRQEAVYGGIACVHFMFGMTDLATGKGVRATGETAEKLHN
jgi:hypothetical protein